MGSYSVRADETELVSLVSRAEAGEEIVLSRDGHAVAKIIPFPEPCANIENSREVLRELEKLSLGISRRALGFADGLPQAAGEQISHVGQGSSAQAIEGSSHPGEPSSPPIPICLPENDTRITRPHGLKLMDPRMLEWLDEPLHEEVQRAFGMMID